ncbi:DinB family protein [Fibrivirga algicola]|uniref:DinB family protein n=1 Tax=Fibrivirga algicola TaxID=2950420 RepID=A0ABX0QK15_9BACT|nr:DinB family protein [Fibrivirga algicola]NID12805.1 DinB family protein [Fibrivirga algicola]
MLLETLTSLFQRDLAKVSSELNQYSNEEQIWAVPPGITNSAGNLCLHLIGNLNTYIGGELGQSGYVRQRDLEFSLRDIPRAVLLAQLDETASLVSRTLLSLDEARLQEEYPLLVFENKTSTGFLLVHLATHLAYHLGQINYHRRLVTR